VTSLTWDNYNIIRTSALSPLKIQYKNSANNNALKFEAYDAFAPPSNWGGTADEDGNVLCYTQTAGTNLKTLHPTCKYAIVATKMTYTVPLTS
jgi:hypothetical protein